MIQCDTCGENLEGDGFVYHQDNLQEIEDAAVESEWTLFREYAWCKDECVPVCQTCAHPYYAHGPLCDYDNGCLCREYVPNQNDAILAELATKAVRA